MLSTRTRHETTIDLRDGHDDAVDLDGLAGSGAASAASEDVPRSGSADAQAPRPRRRIVTGLFWTLTLLLAGLLFLPTLLGYSRYAIVGASMQGTYDQYSAVYEKPVPVADLEVGDVITYVPPADSGIDTLVTHRIISIDVAEDGRPLFRTKGDANPVADPWQFTLDDDEQNVVRFGVPWLGWILIKIADPDFRRLLIGVPAGLIAVRALLDLLGLDPFARLRRQVIPAGP